MKNTSENISLSNEADETSFHIKQVDLEDFFPLPEGNDQYPMEYMENHSVIKIRETDDVVYVGICNKEDEQQRDELIHFHKKNVIFYHIRKSDLTAYLGKKVSALEFQPGTGKRNAESEKLLLDRLANDAPIVNLVNSILIDGIQKGASDIHIESFSSSVYVRYRIDGVLQIGSTINPENFKAVASRIKIMANLNIMEKRLPQDGRISVQVDNDTVDLRVSIVPIAEGESIVLRIFSKKADILKCEDLGFLSENLTILRRLVKHPHGLVLVTGPTGSGKTTTLNAVLREIQSEELKIITIEDPVENVIEGINQIQTHEDIGLTFDSILRRVLRQDPNIIMVGEIRDRNTAQLAIRAALTGHLVLATLHTNDAISAISRLKNMGVESYLLAAVLRGALAQRLVRSICPFCQKSRKPDKRESALLTRLHYAVPPTLSHGLGCKECNHTGYKGRIAVAEIFESDEILEEMIVNVDSGAEFKHYFEQKHVPFLIHNGIAKVLSGFTTMEEVERAVEL